MMNEPVNRRTIGNTASGRDGQGDPLAELARIVGNSDPFADLFNEAKGTQPARAKAQPARPAEPADEFETALRGSYDTTEDGWDEDGRAARSRQPLAATQSRYSGDDEDFDADAGEHDERYDDYPEEAYAPDDAYEGRGNPRTAPRRGMSVIAVAVIAILAAGGAGAYVMKNGSFVGGSFAGLSATPPLIKASTEPLKVKPATPQVPSTSQPTKEIFDRIGGNGSNDPEKVVSREELPLANVPKKVQSVKIVTAEAPADPVSDATGTAAPVIAPLPTRDIATIPASKPTPPTPQAQAFADPAPVTGLPDPPALPLITRNSPEPRKVKTVKVLADNSLVMGEAPAVSTRNIGDAAIPSLPQQELSVTPPVPVAPVPSIKVASAEPQAKIPDELPVQPVAKAPAPLPTRGIDVPRVAAAVPAPAAEADDDATPADATPAVEQQPVVPALPPARPKSIPVAAAKPVASNDGTPPVTAVKPVPVRVASIDPAPAVPAPSAGGGFVVQVSSQKSQADAMAAWQSFQRKYSSVVGGMRPSIKRAEVADRGTFYRVRVGPWGSSADAAAVCSKLKAAGGDCVVARN